MTNEMLNFLQRGINLYLSNKMKKTDNLKTKNILFLIFIGIIKHGKHSKVMHLKHDHYSPDYQKKKVNTKKGW